MSELITVEAVDSMGGCESVVNAARVSFGEHVDEMRPKDYKLLEYLAKHKHMSPFEHCVLSVRINCPMYIRSQIMRHRTFSYNEISRRYTEKDITVHVPDKLRTQASSNRQASGHDMEVTLNECARTLISRANGAALAAYHELLDMGVARETARTVLPCGTMTEFYMTGNLRNWVHFVSLRDHQDAQLEVQVVAKRVKDLLVDRFGFAAECLLRQM